MIKERLFHHALLLFSALFVFSMAFLCTFHPLLANETFELLPYQHTLTMTGYTRPVREMIVTSEVSGICLDMAVDVGDTVAPSGKISKVDRTFIELDIKANTLAQKLTKRQLQLEKKNYDRYTTLLTKQSTPQATLDEVSLNLDINKLQLQKLKNEEIRLQELYKRHLLTGPPGWLVMARMKEPGEYINKGDPVVTLGDYRKLLIPLALTFNELKVLQQITQIELYLPDIGTSVTGKIFRTAPGFDPSTRKISTELIIAGQPQSPEKNLRGGLRVEVQLVSPKQQNTFLVPVSALLNRYEAYWLVAPNKERQRVLYLGRSDNENFALISSSTLTSGSLFLKNPSSPTKE